MKNNQSPQPESGFTIVELMIATAVLSLIILLVTVMMIGIGDLYYKGINQARIQDNARGISDQVSQDLKYNNSFATGSAQVSLSGQTIKLYSYCMGQSVRYTYVLGFKIGNGLDTDKQTPQFNDILVRDSNSYAYAGNESSVSSSCPPIDITDVNFDITKDGGAQELISPNSRLTSFTITGTSPYDVSIGAAYGDIDLLSGLNLNSPSASVVCKGNTGQQFCSTAQLSTVVVQRL